MAERASDRLSRLLGLVPYLTRRPGSTLADVAAQFGVSESQIIDDLELLFVTGRPGHLPDDLIEADWTDGRVYVGNADEVAVPVRLSPAEAGGLLLALGHLRAASAAPAQALESAREKLSRAAGGPGAEAAAELDVAPPTVDPQLAEQIDAAQRTGAALRLTYYVPSRDEVTLRTVTPHRLRLGRTWYLDAWCHTSGGERSFALDRVRASEVVEVPDAAAPAADGRRRAAEADAPTELHLRLTLRPESAWLADELAASARGFTLVYDTAGPGTVQVDVPHAGDAWARRLLGAHGGGVLAVDPPELARQAAETARRGLSLYD